MSAMNDEEKRVPEDEDASGQKPDFRGELLEIINSTASDAEKREKLDNYHDNDIAAVMTELTPEKRRSLYRIFGVERMSDIFAYIDDVEDYIAELDNEKAADIIEQMDADDAIDVLDELDDDQRAVEDAKVPRVPVRPRHDVDDRLDKRHDNPKDCA